LSWSVSGPQALIPGNILALAAVFMLPVPPSSPEGDGDGGGLAAISAALAAVTQSVTANVCLTGVAGEGMDPHGMA
jgi:hypothetical protein